MDGILYRLDDNGFTPMGRLSEIPTITIDYEMENTLPVMHFNQDGWEVSFKIDLLEGYSKKKVRVYRETLGIDLVPLRFPKKKNRRKKRLKRIIRKLITY